MEPARGIIDRLGGANAIATITGVHRTRVYGWMRARELGGTGGVIPVKHAPALLAAAEAQGVHLKAEDFLPMAEVAA